MKTLLSLVSSAVIAGSLFVAPVNAATTTSISNLNTIQQSCHGIDKSDGKALYKCTSSQKGYGGRGAR
ncbi:hypothetical protein [Motilimonas pumila]|uniref:DUF3761 domain-containing protein n=1 Tax=Motilimonas pumila TaxID=2303987 RepID=A0A418YJ24_9GAMM|nr:hypothetical protein [Motilimonas pumila]RJG50622.1 hypothetical protein D1Z90_03885 [Motilimonas pumila]